MADGIGLIDPDVYTRHPMVGWFDPQQLAGTGMQVLVSATLGTRSDFRVIESFAPDQGIFDFSREVQNDFWVDYAADVGDGWNPTYAVASLLARETLSVKQGQGRSDIATSRGRILIFGGDAVYPTADRMTYRERTVGPYECALQESLAPHPQVFAIPGNHDWYDGLVSFSRLFCQPRWLGGWRTAQKRSYFAIRLPHNWWIWGVDIHLESDIDLPQLDYFRKICHDIRSQPGPSVQKVILLTAEPDWVYRNIYDPNHENNLSFLRRQVFGRDGNHDIQLRAIIAGDLHHYRRHQPERDGLPQLITCGGGGAFLHPTIGEPVEEIRLGKEREETYRLAKSFPSEDKCWELLLGNILFPLRNPKFGLLTGFLYAMIGWSLRAALEAESALGQGPLITTVTAVLKSPSTTALILLTILGFVGFTDTHRGWYKVFGGGTHGTIHVLAALFLSYLGISQFSVDWNTPASSLAEAAILFTGGYLLGGFVMGVYLLVSLGVFRRHANEAFSSLKIADYKSFLRLRLSPDGSMTIFPVGLQKIPRKWVKVASLSPFAPKLKPAGAEDLLPELIEDPIKL